MELTNNIIKIVASLDKKKYRTEYGAFAVEGTKAVRDTWNYFECRWIIATKVWYEMFGHSGHLGKIMFASKAQMARMSQFSNPSDVIAVYNLPQYELQPDEIRNNLTLALDNVQDPGNLGTIIRIADWFGIKNIVCSDTTVDAFCHKVIQATMGAISRVKVHYVDLKDFLSEDWGVPVYGTYLDGKNIYESDLSTRGIIVMGNEGKGISPDLAECITDRLLIPSYPEDVVTSESLNVGVATAITVSEFRRRKIMS